MTEAFADDAGSKFLDTVDELYEQYHGESIFTDDGEFKDGAAAKVRSLLQAWVDWLE